MTVGNDLRRLAAWCRRGCLFFAAALTATALLAVPACRKMVPTTIDLDDRAAASGAGISMDARVLEDPGEIESLFKCFLPEKGILPVLVAVRNNDTVPLRLHSANSLGLAGGFDGFRLLVDGEEVLPVHPAEAVAIARGLAGPGGYRKADGRDIVTGTVIAPLGVYYVYKEIRARREYKPLIKASLYPARFEGMFDPLILAPGEEVSGYLYFPIGGGSSPYATREISTGPPGDRRKELVRELDKDRAAKLVLAARPCLGEESGPSEASTHGGLSGPEVRVLLPRAGIGRAGAGPAHGFRGEGNASMAGMGGPSRDRAGGRCEGVTCYLRIANGKSGRALLSGCFSETSGDSLGAARAVAEFRGKSAETGCAEISGDTAVCAVSFKRRSRIYLMDRGDEGFSSVCAEDLPRKTVSLAIGDKGYFSLTSDDFCRFTPFGRGEFTKYVRLGQGTTDIAGLAGGRILALSRDETVLMDAAGEDMFRVIRRKDIGRGKSTVIGYCGSAVTVLTEGNGDAGDTLSFFDPERLEEISRRAFTGKIRVAAPHGEGAVILLQEGTILDIRPVKPDSAYISQSGYLPLDVSAIAADGDRFTAVTTGGALIRGRVSDFSPRMMGNAEAPDFTVRVGTAGGGKKKGTGPAGGPKDK